MNVANQKINLPILAEKKLSLHIKREDLIHSLISGNKYRKLKYNLARAKNDDIGTILTFGGAHSNHIAATAYAAKESKLKSIGVIRGEELYGNWEQNPTLSLARKHGMEFKFVSREQYREKEDKSFLNRLRKEFGKFYHLPEGGTNALAVRGCEEILTDIDTQFDVICCPVGTGGTLAGIINSSQPDQSVLGFPALKGDFLKKDIRKFVQRKNWELQTDYHFGGYAKVSENLIAFINDFRQKTGIPLDPVYTGKMMHGILEMVKKDGFKSHSRILAIHTGGLQGITGMNQKLKKKNLPLIDL